MRYTMVNDLEYLQRSQLKSIICGLFLRNTARKQKKCSRSGIKRRSSPHFSWASPCTSGRRRSTRRCTEELTRQIIREMGRYFEKWFSKSASPISRSSPRKCYLPRSGLHCCQNLLKEMLCALHPIPGAGFVLQCKDAGVIVVEHDAHIPLNVGLAEAIPELGVNCSVRVGS